MGYRGRSYHAWLLGSAAAIAISSAASAADNAQFDIAPQPLASALNEFSLQSHQSVLFTTDLASAKSSQGVSGQVQVADALSSLLAGTGLSWKKQGGTYLIVDASDPQSGSAAGDGADAGTVQALIVTAQKREENIQDVPIAMSAFTQEDLTRSQVAGGPDLMTQVPNMTFTKTNFSSYSIQIRGIGTQAISATTDAAVAVAFNNTPFIRNHFFEQEFYDLQRVEVLRGPQGTLYGRNATAGVVNVISAKPKFVYEAKAAADVANYGSTRLEGMINLPLVDDKVALRIAGAWTKRNGYAVNQITGNPIDGRDLWSTRVSLRFTPNDRIDANLIWEHFEENDDRIRSGKQLCKTHDVVGKMQIGGLTLDNSLHEDGGQGAGSDDGALAFAGPSARFSLGCEPSSLYSPDSFQTVNGLSLPYYAPLGVVFLPTALNDPYASRGQSHDLRVIESTVDPSYKAMNDLGELQVSIDLTDHLTLTSETAYSADELFSTQDYNRFTTAPGAWRTTNERAGVITPGPNGGIFCDPQIGCTDRLVAMDLSQAQSRQFSQEFRVSSDYDGPFNFSLGANWLRFDNEDKYYVFINSLSIIAAISPYSNSKNVPYVGGETDNSQCMYKGLPYPDPTKIQGVLGCIYMDSNPIGSLNDLGHNYFLSKNPYKLISYAVFGEAYYNITDGLKLTAGLRWTVDKKEAPRIPSWILAGKSFGYPVTEVVDQEWREPTGRLAIDWKPDLSFTDDTLVYASFAHGYKAGGANPPPAGAVMYAPPGENAVAGGVNVDYSQAILRKSATHPRTFDPEFVNAYEVGAKNTLLDGRATLNLAAFYYDYTGYQISQISNRSAVNLNFDAKVWGLEIEADWRPVENLRLGFKGGYENTRVDDGEQAVDVMDRANGGKPDKNGDRWIVVKPFPTFANNCVLPEYIFEAVDGGPQIFSPGGVSGGNPGPCELAYTLGVDPVTQLAYVPDPTVAKTQSWLTRRPGYKGFNPLDESLGHNFGEGFYKDLSGNELPNAPHFTATLTADYTLPLPSSWLMTLHTDLYYQSEAWTRIFNTPGYDKLKAYTNVNLAAIFANEDAGWRVMAYVKNVFDRDSITGAFLNSDDSGLTTNVFLTEPRLYGLRVTKEFTGGPWWNGANPNHVAGEPYPLTVELAGQVQKVDAPYATLAPGFVGGLPASLNLFDPAQHRDLDTGDGREIKITYQPGGKWSLAASARYGRTNGGKARMRSEFDTDKACALPSAYAYLCPLDPASFYTHEVNFADITAASREEHEIVDFVVGYDFGIGALDQSRLSLGLRYARLESETSTTFDTVPDWRLYDGWGYVQPAYHTRHQGSIDALRKLRGAGPTISWDAGKRVVGNDQSGHVNVDWSVGAGLLFGKQEATFSGLDTASYYADTGFPILNRQWSLPVNVVHTPVGVSPRSKNVTIPVVDLSLGLSYEIDRIKIGTGYRWERYFNALDAGYAEHKDYDRTLDGPYFKIAVGFGG